MKLVKALRKSKIALVFVIVISFCAAAAYAVGNSVGKPRNEGEVPGSWTLDQSKSVNLWFSWRDSDNNTVENPLAKYSPEVRERFADPDLSLFGDHPDFAGDMNFNYDNPTGTVKFLTNTQMNEYLDKLARDPANNSMAIRYMGDYPKGIRMPLLVFSHPKLSDPSGENLRALGKPIFYLRAQVHGNEAAAGSGAILLAQRLARGHADLSGVLDKISIVILPRMNGDGAKIHQRGTSLVSGDTWADGPPNYLQSVGAGGGQSEYGGGLMSGLDQNRDNLWLGTPVSRANARIFSEYMPEVCLDAHEYGSNGWLFLPKKNPSAGGNGFVYETDSNQNNWVKLEDSLPGTVAYWKEQMTTQWGNHLLIPEGLRNLSETIQQQIVADLKSPSNPTGPFYWAPYVEGSYGLVVSGDGSVANGGLVSLDTIPQPEAISKMAKWADANGNIPALSAYRVSTEGGFDPGTARNTMGLIPGISFLAESRSPGGRWEFPRRVMGQYLTSLYYIKSIIKNLDTVKSQVASARAAVISEAGDPNGRVAITQTYAQQNYNNIETYGIYHQDGTSEDIPGLRRNSRFGTVPVFVVSRPYAYIVDGANIMADDIAFRMGHLNLKFERLTEDKIVNVTAYTVSAAANSPSFGATSRITGVTSADISKNFPAGSYIFYMDQQMANYAAVLFEPMSMRSWAGKDVAVPQHIIGKEVPFYRYESSAKIIPAIPMEIPVLDFTDVFLYNVKPYSVSDLDAAKTKLGVADGYAQAMTVYGDMSGITTLKAYLPFDGIYRTWRVRERGSFVEKKPAFDSAMNRHYISIDGSSISGEGDGYYKFDVFVTSRNTPKAPFDTNMDALSDSGATVTSAKRTEDGGVVITVTDANLSDDELLYVYFVEKGTTVPFIAAIISKETVATGNADEYALTFSPEEAASLTGNATYAIQYSNADASVKGYGTFTKGALVGESEGKDSGGGCNAGFPVLALLTAVPIIVRRSRQAG
ncbi:MAG: SYNERG-CTERM sorting domain-containing protein [Synergistaceae bacterium]|jgi:Synergist-CTERM protein sorting domain-containing protein|nr:SYNERG-CTERM sorting domain-containing protein [Synergistaceae bacterium]